MKASAKGHYEVVELLLSAQARVNQTGWVRNCDSALMKASAEGHYEVVKLLLSSQARVDQTGRVRNFIHASCVFNLTLYMLAFFLTSIQNLFLIAKMAIVANRGYKAFFIVINL